MKKIFTLIAAVVSAMSVGAKDFTDNLHLTVMGNDLNSESTITVDKVEGSDDTYDITLNDFSFDTFPLGDIKIEGVKGETAPDGMVSFEETTTSVTVINVTAVFGDDNFPKAYTDDLTATFMGEASAPQPTTIFVETQADGKYTLSLKNFKFGTMGVGNVVLTDVEGTDNGGVVNLSAEQTIKITEGDDPDVTHGHEIGATVAFSSCPGIHFLQGEGVGRVTLLGLGIPVGEPAINRVPRSMMTRELTTRYPGEGLDVTIFVPEGRALALRTFNPKLGIVDGISILGTLGIVRPFSTEAFIDSIRREIEVCLAVGSSRLVINSGAKSERFVKRLYPELPPQAFVHFGNFIGETIKLAASLGVREVTMGIMLGKAVKLAEGNLDTHSKKTLMNKAFLKSVAQACGCSPQADIVIENLTLARELWHGLSSDDADLFFPQLLRLCRQHTAPLLPDGRLEILLIDEDGDIRYRI